MFTAEAQRTQRNDYIFSVFLCVFRVSAVNPVCYVLTLSGADVGLLHIVRYTPSHFIFDFFIQLLENLS